MVEWAPSVILNERSRPLPSPSRDIMTFGLNYRTYMEVLNTKEREPSMRTL